MLPSVCVLGRERGGGRCLSTLAVAALTTEITIIITAKHQTEILKEIEHDENNKIIISEKVILTLVIIHPHYH